jgi:hypothetical protein
MTGERFLVRSNKATAGFGDCLRNFRGSASRLFEPAFGRAQTLPSGFCFARTSPGWSTLDHAETLSLFRMDCL